MGCDWPSVPTRDRFAAAWAMRQAGLDMTCCQLRLSCFDISRYHGGHVGRPPVRLGHFTEWSVIYDPDLDTASPMVLLLKQNTFIVA